MRTSLLSATFVALALFSAVAAEPAAAQVRPGGQPGPSSPSGTNVAVVDVAHIFENFDRFKAKMDDIKRDMDNFEQFLKTEQEKLRASSEQLKDFNAGSAEFKRLEDQLVQADTNLRLQTARQKKDFLDREATVYFNHYTEVVGHVQAIAQQNNIGLVLRFSSKDMEPDKRESVLQGVNRAIVYHAGLDITNLVLDRLNRFTPPQNATKPTGPAIPGAPRRQ